MAGIAKQIIGSFEDIGKDVIQEAANVPKDIAGKMLESLGTSSQKTQNPQVATTQQKTQEGALGKLDQTKDQKIKQIIAREALAQLARKPQQKEPTIQERLEEEEKQKKEAAKKQQQQQMAPLPVMSSKPKRGNLFGVTKQKAGSETGKNIRQD